MQDFPANSAKAKARTGGPAPEERPSVEQVTSAKAVRRKRRLGRKFKETFIGGSGRMAFEYMVTDVVIPAVQDTMLDALQGGLERLIKGENRTRRSTPIPPGYSNVGRVDYARMSQAQTKPPAPRTLSQQARARMNFSEIVIPNRMEAEEVIERMYDVLSRYGRVEVAVLYGLTGIASSHTDHKWGWTDLHGARATRYGSSGSYVLQLPDPEPLG